MAFDFKKHWKIYTLVILILLVGIIYLILNLQNIARPFNQSKNVAKPYVDPQIYKLFENGTVWVSVDIYVNTTFISLINFVEKINSSNDFSRIRLSTADNSFAARITQNGLKVLENNKYIIKIYYNAPIHAFLNESVPLINANLVWNLNYTGEGKTICVIDSGVNKTHPALQNKVIGEHCFCSVSGFYGCCPNGLSEQGENGSARDDYGHGTYVTGIIESTDFLYRGVAYNSKIVAIRVFDSDGNGEMSDVKKAILWCKDNAANYSIFVISGSLGDNTISPPDDCSGDVDSAVEDAYNSGLTMVFSSGQEPSSSQGISYPACLPKVISVASSFKSDNQLGNCRRGPNLNLLLAPGVGIRSLIWDPTGTCFASCDCYSNYMICSGTSAAAPHVAGAAALLLQLKPDLTPDQIKDVLNLTGKQIQDTGYSNRTYSRIDVYKAIMAVNASLLQVVNLSVLNKSGNVRYFEVVIRNANLTNISNISWQIDMGLGDAVIKSNENISLLFGESAILILAYNFTQPGNHQVTVSINAGNLFDSKTIAVLIGKGDVSVTEINDLYTNGYSKILEFKIKNIGDNTLNNINWSFDFGDGVKSYAKNLITLQEGEDEFVYLSHNYSQIMTYNVNATAFVEVNKSASLTNPITFKISVPALTVLNSSSGKRVFEVVIRNPLPFNLSDVNWTLTFGDGSTASNNGGILLTPNEIIFIIAEHNYTLPYTYEINATARNGTLIDSKNITVDVSS